jgi:hypothetical protein
MSAVRFRSFVSLGVAPRLRDMFLSNTPAILGRLVSEQTAVAVIAQNTPLRESSQSNRPSALNLQETCYSDSSSNFAGRRGE